MKPRHAAALALVGLVVAACAGRDSWDSDNPIVSVLHPQLIAARKKHLDTLREQCQLGDCRADCEYKPMVVGDPLPGEPEMTGCRTLCETGDQAACIDYKRLLCAQGVSCLP